jgi:TolA-binding protein
MERVAFFALVLACGGPRATPRAEVALPLPTVSASAAVDPAPSSAPQREEGASDDPGDPRPRSAMPLPKLSNQARILERLVTTTAQNDPNRPSLLLRLADAYVQMRKAGADLASKQAIARYEELVATYPTFADDDAAYFGLGLEHLVVDDAAKARRAFFELIKRYPSSSYVPYAFFAFGQLFERQKQWQGAQLTYEKTLGFAGSPIRAEALCALARVYAAQGDAAQAANVRARLQRELPTSRAARYGCRGPR